MFARKTLQLVVLACSISGASTLSAADERPPLTLESIFSGTEFRSETVDDVQWSGDGESFTFTRRNPDSGFLDLYEHDVASGKPRLLLSGAELELDGTPVELGGYQWANDRRYILVSGPVTRTWDNVFESSWFVYELDEEVLRQLADGKALRNVYLSPDGRRVGYVVDNDLYVAELDTGEIRAITTDGSSNIFNGIFDYGSTEFGFTEAWHWSPDGRRIAFWRLDATDVKVFYIVDELGKYNDVHPLKYPNAGESHAVNRIGVYDLQSGRTTWMATGHDPNGYIPRIDWLPSSETLAIQRLTRDHQRLDLMLADVTTGETRIVVTDRDPAWVDITTDLMFLEGQDRFVWTSEKSGFRHSYLYDYAGNETQLTRGNWEISSLIGIDEAGGWLYFYAKKDSLIDQHVYRVRLTGSEVEKISDRPGWHEWRPAPDGKHVIATWSDAATPPVTTLRRASGEPMRLLVESQLEGLEHYAVPEREFLQFETSDGVVLNASMIKPLDFVPNKKYPVIGYGYGNAGSQVVVNRWRGHGNVERELWHRYLATQGFIVFSLDNRTTAGRGKAASNLTYGHYAKWAVLDQLQGVEYLESLPYVDSSRLGFWGWSGGGYLACALMTKGAPHFKTGVCVAPVVDLRRYQAVGVERWMGFTEENEDGYRKVNLMKYADRLEGDLLLIHGTGDENVKFAFTLQFAQSLIEQNKQFDMMVYPNQHHGIEDAQLHVYTKIADYFIENL